MKKSNSDHPHETSILTNVVDTLFATLIQEMDFSFASISRINRAAGELITIGAMGIARVQRNRIRLIDEIPKNDIHRKIIDDGKKRIRKRINRYEKQWYSEDASTRSVRIFIPLKSYDTVTGILEAGFVREERPDITHKEQRLLESIARQTAVSIENILFIEQLHQEHHLLHTLMDTIPDSIYFKDTKSRFIRASRALAEKFGISDPDALIGKTDFDLFTDEHAKQAFTDEQRILETGIPEIDIIEKETWNDNRITWVSTTKMPLQDDEGATIGTFGVSRDITSRKEMEDALKFRLEFEEHITSLSTKFINIDLQYFDGAVHDALKLIGTFTSANRSFILLLNESGNIINKFHEWYVGDEKPNRHRFATLAKDTWLQNTMKNGHDIIIRSTDDLPEDGTDAGEIWKNIGVKSLVYVPLILTGMLGGVIGIESLTDKREWAEDTTALLKIIGEVIINAFSRKRAEEKLQHANNVLEQRVALRTRDLRNANNLLTTHIGQLKFLNASVYTLSPIINIDELLPAILNIFLSRFPKAEGAICLNTDTTTECTYTTSALNTDENKNNLYKAAMHFIEKGQPDPIIVNDRFSDDILKSMPITGIDELTVYLALPLITDNDNESILQIFTTGEYTAKFAVEQSLITTLGAYASICLSNAINYQQRAEKARLDGELNAARSIQKRFTPHHRPNIPDIDLKGVYYPAYKVGGDYLDYFETERGDWVIVVADVCGKGIPAALLMTTIRSAFRIHAENETSARSLLCAVNKFMVYNIDERSFVTVLCLMIKKDGSEMTYARGGHPFLIKLDSAGNPPQNIPCSGIALGLMQDVNLFTDITEEKTIPLISGERYLIFTDGLVEAADTKGDSYGLPRLNNLLAHDNDSSPGTLIDKIITDVRSFTKGAPDHDDLTLLCFKVG